MKANARTTGPEAEFTTALDEFCDQWNRGTADRAYFEMEYLLAVGTRVRRRVAVPAGGDACRGRSMEVRSSAGGGACSTAA